MKESEAALSLSLKEGEGEGDGEEKGEGVGVLNNGHIWSANGISPPPSLSVPLNIY